MKILLVNNHTLHLDSLKDALAGHEVEIVTYEPGITFNETDKDLVVLSGGGGEGLEIDDKHELGKLWYEDEMNFVLRTKKPLLGICMGFEVVTKAYGADVKQLGYMVRGLTHFKPTKKGRDLLNAEQFGQFEFHEWHVPSVSTKHFEILAESDTGIEIIKHRSRPILATQFHPEKGGTLSVKKLVAQLA